MTLPNFQIVDVNDIKDELVALGVQLACVHAQVQDLRNACRQKQEILDADKILIADFYAQLREFKQLRFPAQIRKTWTADEVQLWIDEQRDRITQNH